MHMENHTEMNNVFPEKRADLWLGNILDWGPIILFGHQAGRTRLNSKNHLCV